MEHLESFDLAFLPANTHDITCRILLHHDEALINKNDSVFVGKFYQLPATSVLYHMNSYSMIIRVMHELFKLI